jgi:putative endonuclease
MSTLTNSGRNQGDTGSRGESLAAAFLRRSRGFAVVAANWRNPRDRREEIDLVCRDGEALVFIEVKTRAPGAIIPGYYAVNRRKKAVLRRAIRSYLRLLRHQPRLFRFDIVEVEMTPGAPVLRHFENIPLFPKYFRG